MQKSRNREACGTVSANQLFASQKQFKVETADLEDFGVNIRPGIHRMEMLVRVETWRERDTGQRDDKWHGYTQILTEAS